MTRDEVVDIFLPGWVGFYPEGTLSRERAEKHAPRINAKRKEKAGLFADDESFTRATVTADTLLAGRERLVEKGRETDETFLLRAAGYAQELRTLLPAEEWGRAVSFWTEGKRPKQPHFLADYLHGRLREATGYVSPRPSFDPMSKEKATL